MQEFINAIKESGALYIVYFLVLMSVIYFGFVLPHLRRKSRGRNPKLLIQDAQKVLEAREYQCHLEDEKILVAVKPEVEIIIVKAERFGWFAVYKSFYGSAFSEDVELLRRGIMEVNKQLFGIKAYLDDDLDVGFAVEIMMREIRNIDILLDDVIDLHHSGSRFLGEFIEKHG